jgi:hypothetical protein
MESWIEIQMTNILYNLRRVSKQPPIRGKFGDIGQKLRDGGNGWSWWISLRTQMVAGYKKL